MDKQQEENMLERLSSCEIRTEAITMLLIEELGISRERIQRAVDVVIKYSIIAQEEKLDREEHYRRRSAAFVAPDAPQEPPAASPTLAIVTEKKKPKK